MRPVKPTSIFLIHPLAQIFDNRRALPRKLDPVRARQVDVAAVSLDEKSFRLALNADAMANEKTAEGIRVFAADIVRLERLIEQRRH